MKTIIPILAATLIATLALATSASAYNEADFERFKKTKKCPNCDLSGVKLRGKKASFYKADLRWANLSGADLQKAVFWRANLEGANLTDALLLETNFRYANLKKVNFTGADLRRAVLRFADMQGAQFRGANLRRAMMVSSKLQGAKMKKAKLRSARLRDATWIDGKKCKKGSVGKCVR